MINGFSARLRPQYLVRDRAVLTGNTQRIPERFGVDVVDPVSGRPARSRYFATVLAQSPTSLAVHGFRGDHHGLTVS